MRPIAKHRLLERTTSRQLSWKMPKKQDGASRSKWEAQTLRQKLTGKSLDEDDQEKGCDEMIAYFYR